jgi:hypothetical protein
MGTALAAFPALVVAAVAILGCSRTEPEPRPGAETAPSVTAESRAASPLVLARGVRIVQAGAGSDAAKVVRDERARAQADGRDLVVYVGARWCEPCQRFHKAAQKGELDGALPDLTILEFDLDDDRDRLAAAGYVSELIPLFALPGPDGRASAKKLEGSIKGDGAVANITPRLRALLGK